MKFEWDVAKALRNRLKHGVSFADAVIALHDEYAITIEDKLSEGEKRFVTIGMGDQLSLLVVVFTHLKEKIRIISARKASRKETRIYEKGIRFQ
jgi:uncharacterized DUF497 family protein